MKNFLLLLAVFAALCHPASTSAQEKGAVPVLSPQSAVTGVTRAVVIGISDYQDPAIPDLRFADKDAEAFANFLRSPAGGSLDGDHLKVLLNSEATMAQFANALDWLMEESKEGDQAIVYFSGHGDVEKKTLTQPGFLLCWDAPARVYMAGGAFALPMLQEVISTLSIQNKAKVVVITDACRSGTLAGSGIGGSQATAANLAKQFGNEIKILSCQPNEYSIEGEQWGDGRGAFSFNLVDALYGLADGNNDLFVTLQEVGRYLEDHVTAEVAPISQVPMVLGNRTERLAAVDANLLADLRSGRTNQMKMLSPVEMRGLEEDVLASVDTTVREVYRLFKKALKDKVFLEPATACADAYYEQLVAEPKLARLHSTMRRNYAAALQDDAQQAMNIWIKADVQQLECIGKSLKLEPIPRQLRRAAELLGEGHYMHRSLLARRLLFEGINLHIWNMNPDEALGRKCIALFRQSAETEAQSALPWQQMATVFAAELRQPDSAFICAQVAHGLAPNWVMPFTDLATIFHTQSKHELEKQALEAAGAVDTLHPFVIQGWASWHYVQPGPAAKAKAVALMEQYRESGGAMYPCWHNAFALALAAAGKLVESESEFKKGLALDSTKHSIWGNLGFFYNQTRRYAEAEPALKKAIALDSANHAAWSNLGFLYQEINRFGEAEQAFKKAIAIDSTYFSPWNNLGFLYLQTRRFAEAELVFKKVIALDSTISGRWNNLGFAYLNNRKYAEAEAALKKAIALDSMYANPRKHLGMACFKTNRPEEARQNFQKALERNPNYIAAMLSMAYLLHSEGKIADALGYVEQAIGKGSNFEQLETDEDLAPLRVTQEWKALMKKYFPKEYKD